MLRHLIRYITEYLNTLKLLIAIVCRIDKKMLLYKLVEMTIIIRIYNNNSNINNINHKVIKIYCLIVKRRVLSN